MKKRFNLIEITLAMAVLALGMTGVMALFPVGFKANNESVGTNNAVLVANKVYGIIKASKSQDWNKWFFNSKLTVPDHRPGTYLGPSAPSDKDAGQYGDICRIQGSAPYLDKEYAVAQDPKNSGHDLFEIYGVGDAHSRGISGGPYPGVLYAQLMDGSSDMPTFQAHVRVWWVPVKRAELKSSPAQYGTERDRFVWDTTNNRIKDVILDSTKIVGVHMEVCWPTDISWEKRNFRHFYFEIYKNN